MNLYLKKMSLGLTLFAAVQFGALSALAQEEHSNGASENLTDPGKAPDHHNNVEEGTKADRSKKVAPRKTKRNVRTRTNTGEVNSTGRASTTPGSSNGTGY